MTILNSKKRLVNFCGILSIALFSNKDVDQVLDYVMRRCLWSQDDGMSVYNLILVLEHFGVDLDVKYSIKNDLHRLECYDKGIKPSELTIKNLPKLIDDESAYLIIINDHVFPYVNKTSFESEWVNDEMITLILEINSVA